MAKTTPHADLARVIQQLQAQRQEHVDAVAEIDEQFDEYGIPAKPRRRRGRKRRGPGRPPKVGKKETVKKKAKGKKFKLSGEQSILDFVKKKHGATTAEIVGNWRRQGRGGKADNALTKLVQEGKLKRERIEGGRGSRYSVA